MDKSELTEAETRLLELREAAELVGAIEAWCGVGDRLELWTALTNEARRCGHPQGRNEFTHMELCEAIGAMAERILAWSDSPDEPVKLNPLAGEDVDDLWAPDTSELDDEIAAYEEAEADALHLMAEQDDDGARAADLPPDAPSDGGEDDAADRYDDMPEDQP